MTGARHQQAAAEAAKKAAAAADHAVADELDRYAADIEAEGRARAPQWMREAARRLRGR